MPPESFNTTRIEQILTDIALAIRNDDSDVEVASLVYASGWSALSGHAVQAVKVGKTVYLRGMLTKNAAWVASELAATIPDGFRPNPNMAEANIIYFTAHNLASTNTNTLNVYTSAPASGSPGQIVARPAGSSGQWISLYGISYQVE